MVVRKKSARAKAKAVATEGPGQLENAEEEEEEGGETEEAVPRKPPDVPAPSGEAPPEDAARWTALAEQVASFDPWEAESAQLRRRQASFVVRLGGSEPRRSLPPAEAEGEEERIQEVLAMSVLKVVFGEEVRRLRVQLPRATADAAAAWLLAVRGAVQQGLELCEERCARGLRLSYVDAAGSTRVLDGSTAFDCAAHFEGDTLRLVADWAPPQRREGDILWAARDGRAHIGLAMTFSGLQPILVARGYQFEISIRKHEVSERLVSEAFNGSGVHTALLEDCLDALCSLAHAVAGAPSWHRIELEDGRSFALRLCVELQADIFTARHDSADAHQG